MSALPRPPASVHTPGMSSLCKEILDHVRELLESGGAKDPAHDVKHVEAVTAHVKQALLEEDSLDDRHKSVAVMAALLHEADDEKLFPGSGINATNTRRILAQCLPVAIESGAVPGGKEAQASITDEVVEVIDRVSARKNKDAGVPKGKEWQLIVRDADRIEAVGEVGIARCFAYNQKVGAPLFVASTPRPTNEKEIWQIATPERFAAYNGESASMIDHYYDKLLHLQKCGSGSKYLEGQLNARLQIMLDFVLEFSRKGEVDVDALKLLQAKHCGSKPKQDKVVAPLNSDEDNKRKASEISTAK